jgi:uncharacterized membrane protein
MVSELTGWQPLVPRRGAEAFVVTPFMRLARTHIAAMAGNTLIAIALAHSIFFSAEPDQARSQVVLYLALTFAPFAVVAPSIGPWLDRIRGGRRGVVIASNGLRVVICVLMIRELDSLLLFPLAFLVLVLDKAYHVAKAALVPATVPSEEGLVAANSLLTRLSGIVGFVVAGPGLAANWIGEQFGVFEGAQAVLVLAVIAFTAGTVAGWKIPSTRVATDTTTEEERQELRRAGILLGVSAIALMRAMVGFMTFLIAFDLRGDEARLWEYGFVLGAHGVGSLLGSWVAPALRQADVVEERMLMSALAAATAVSLAAVYLGGFTGRAMIAFALGVVATTAKLAFDAIVQRDAPDVNRGRSFARFEMRFQLGWAVGAFIPVVVPIPLRIGFLMLTFVAVFALVSYMTGLRAVAAGRPVEQRSVTRGISRRIRNNHANRKRRGRGAPDDPARPQPGSRQRTGQSDDDTTVVIDPTKLQ